MSSWVDRDVSQEDAFSGRNMGSSVLSVLTWRSLSDIQQRCLASRQMYWSEVQVREVCAVEIWKPSVYRW